MVINKAVEAELQIWFQDTVELCTWDHLEAAFLYLRMSSSSTGAAIQPEIATADLRKLQVCQQKFQKNDLQNEKWPRSFLYNCR